LNQGRARPTVAGCRRPAAQSSLDAVRVQLDLLTQAIATNDRESVFGVLTWIKNPNDV